MKSFKEHLLEQEQLDEVLITFGKKAYPKFGNVVILAGGAASGKGFVVSNLLGIEGRTFNVDLMKEFVTASTIFAARIKKETGVDLKKLDINNAEDANIAHEIIVSLFKVNKTYRKLFLKSILLSDPSRKPNLIFDGSLKDIPRLEDISDLLIKAGYKKENIHIVWVINSIDIALKQNKDITRGRQVRPEVLIQAHEGAALTMKKIVSMGSKLKKYMDGDIWFAFNEVGVDTEYVKSKNKKINISQKVKKNQEKTIGAYLKRANIFKIKEKGKPSLTPDQIGKNILDKIIKNTPKISLWGE